MNKIYFHKKQDLLFAALKRCKDLVSSYAKRLDNWDEEYNWDFNLLHDMEYRIEDRIKELQSEYQSWHFEKYGWVSL